MAGELNFQRLKQPNAIARALNRSIGSASTIMSREMAGDLGLKVGDVKTEMRVKEARPDDLVARLSVSGKRIPLIKFGAKGPEPSRGRGRGVTARLSGGRNRYPNAFIATVGSGHRGVFIRKASLLRKSPGAWGKNLPITELRGPSLPHVFRKFLPIGLARGQEQLAKNLAHELSFAARSAA
jgi:hypothetical protein